MQRDPCPLTDQQLATVQFTSHGLPAKVVAYEMGIKECTVINYLQAAKLRAGAKNMAHLVGIAVRKGWVE